ncbi:DUF7835 family putative zinc beta-ribbon protein [Natranaeroarchaeum sulfidigenes]|uniref:Zn finger protein, C2H2 type n=1 Tax=Natranaeroarchaeum sulfidigenes TaxID=2784880 RepID=A0A897MYP8_9EURY|nr:hypothetical protein [Natranaeroarchaeum sulfidigenes]QSG04019.1 Zn finger protein, C2H2 type [Natranaeroarchaeum sulfidigenes]
MATTEGSFDGVRERCDSCDVETTHRVSVQLKTESRKEENAQFSREPYRIAECQECGTRTSQRMNNA